MAVKLDFTKESPETKQKMESYGIKGLPTVIFLDSTGKEVQRFFGFRDADAFAQVLVEGSRLGLDLGDKQLLDRYQRWRSLDALSVAVATDSLTRIYGIPGKTASAVRRFGMGMIDRLTPIKNKLMSEARGTSGELPLLLRGLPI